MARPKKIKTDIMDSTEMIEVKKDAEPVVIPADVEITATKNVKDETNEMLISVVKAVTPEPDKTPLPTPICDIEELSEDDKQVIIEKRIKAIISQTQAPFIPALIRFTEPGTTAVPPMYALVNFDHRFVDEGWKFYQTNVKEPYAKDYLNLLTKVMATPNAIFPRLVMFNYE